MVAFNNKMQGAFGQKSKSRNQNSLTFIDLQYSLVVHGVPRSKINRNTARFSHDLYSLLNSYLICINKKSFRSSEQKPNLNYNNKQSQPHSHFPGLS